MRTTTTILFTLCVLGTFTGCGHSNASLAEKAYRAAGVAEVTGTITFDGQPLAHAQIQFSENAHLGSSFCYGVTDANGRYRMRVDSHRTGSLPGDKVVRVWTTLRGSGISDLMQGPYPDKETIPLEYNRESKLTVRARVQEAIQNGFDAIAITDHIEYRPFLGSGILQLAENNDDHDAAYKMAKPEADRANLILIKGTEITKRTMPPGHFNVIFIKDANAIAAVVDDWKKMLAVATDQGGFVFWDHPGWVAPTSGGLERGVPMSFTDEHEDVRKKGHLHGVEVFNGTSHFPIVSDWCNERDLGLITVSDVHSSELQMYGLQNPRRPITLVLAEERTEESMRAAFCAPHHRLGGGHDLRQTGMGAETLHRLYRNCARSRERYHQE